MPPGLLLLGAGGHAKVLVDLAGLLGWSISGLIDPGKVAGSILLGVPVMDERVLEQPGCGPAFVAIGDNAIRWREHGRLKQRGIEIPALVHPKSTVAGTASIERGTVIMAGAVIQAAAKIGEATVINTSAIVDHDCEVGDGAFVGPGAILCGGVKIGAHAFVGAGTVITPNVQVAAKSFIKAGVRITRDVMDWRAD